jgi:hypothetical protein
VPASEVVPKGGDNYIVVTPFEAIVMVQFFAPFTGGDRRSLPSGLQFSIWGEPVSTASAVSAKPLDEKHWESALVSEDDRAGEKYGGYSLVISRADLAERCRQV